MLKRSFIFLLSIASAILITSCTSNPIDVLSEEGALVTIVVGLNEDDITTRVISDGKSVNQLIYSVYNSSGQIVIPKTIKHDITNLATSNEHTFTITLPTGSDYRMICWAQNSTCKAYSVSDDMKVSIDYKGANNDEFRDAFFGISEPFDVNDGTASIVLKRPFAQLNVAAHPFEWEYVNNFHKFNITQSSAVIRNVPNVLNLKDGTVSGSVNAYFSPAAIPTEKMHLDIDQNGENEEYVYLSMSYILAANEPTKHSVDFFFLDDKNQSVKLIHPDIDGDGTEDGIIELQRNHNGVYVGQVVTNLGELNVVTYNDSGNTENGNVYYFIQADTTIKDITYNLSNYNAAIQFDSNDGEVTTLENVTFTGDIWTIELGKYRTSFYVNYTNLLNNVVMKDLSVSNGLECHEWYFSPAVIAYGKSTLNNCTMTGTTTTCLVDRQGVPHQYIPVDLGIRNESEAIINGGRYGTVFAWTHAVVDIYGADIDTLYCGTCDSTPHSWMTVGAGTTVDKIICCEPRCPYGTKEYSTTMTIKKNANVGSIQLVSTDVEFLIIENGANVGKITCNGVEYSYEELRSAMGL